jgi:two-component system, cell cycle response regulator
MSNSTLDKILNCQTLPSLPGVAMRVLELAQNRNVATAEIAATIQADAALTAKVLRTVNSSFYGLTTPCPSIKRATSLLGINSVKSIVLGFSLVDSTRRAGLDKSFDMLTYWRRSVYSAAAARSIAMSQRLYDPEEAFIGAMVQDIGVLAFAATLRGEYDAVLAQIPEGDHELHAGVEREKFSVDHTEVGALLAEKWRLPPQIIEGIRWHHAPERCTPTHEALVKCVYAGKVAAAALSTPTPEKRRLGAYVTLMRTMFGVDAAPARELLVQINEGAEQLAKSMDIKTGEHADVSELMSRAHEQMIATQEEIQRESVELRRSNEDLARQTVTDALTGAFNRAHFDREIAAAWERANREKTPLTVLFSDADKFKSVNDTHGHQAGDAVLMELAKRMRETLGDLGVVCRYGGEEFAVIVPGADTARAEKVAELIRRKIAASPFQFKIDGTKQLTLPVTISIGFSTHDVGVGSEFTSFEQLVHAADSGVYAAKQAGRNCVKRGSLEATKPTPSVIRVLVIEDDPLAAKLLGFVFEKHRDFVLTFVDTGEKGVEAALSGDAAMRPDLILSDLHLPGISGIDAVRTIREHNANIACVILSASMDAKVQADAKAVGASLYMDKMDFCRNSDGWIDRLSALVRPGTARAAA